MLYPLTPPGFGDKPARRTNAPLLCIEIHGAVLWAPSQSLEQMVDKMRLYFDFGVRSCWVVVPAVRGVFVFDQPDQYQFFHHTETLRDSALTLELGLEVIFA